MKNNKLREIEKWEDFYLEHIKFMLLKDTGRMIEALNSKDVIKEDWINVFLKKACDIDRGAERIYFWLLNQLGIPNSTPIGSDLMYETSNAFLHLDVKTSSYWYKSQKQKTLKINKSDFYGVVSVGQNQTSYTYSESNSGKKIDHSANLPPIYKYEKKLCLTYIIQLIHEKEKDGNLKIIAVLLICVPNGLLKTVYKDIPFGGSKNKGEAFRYYYKRDPKFKLLAKRKLRVKVLYIHSDYQTENILGFKIK